MAAENELIAVRSWLMEAPFDDPARLGNKPDFSYDTWLSEGLRLPNVVPILIRILEEENPRSPSELAERAAYALGFIGDNRAIPVLVRSIESSDPKLRSEAVASLGRLGDPGVLPALERLLTDEREDINVRGNASIAIGRLGVPASEPPLRDALKSSDPFLVRCAQEALRLYSIARSSSSR